MNNDVKLFATGKSQLHGVTNKFNFDLFNFTEVNLAKPDKNKPSNNNDNLNFDDYLSTTSK